MSMGYNVNMIRMAIPYPVKLLVENVDEEYVGLPFRLDGRGYRELTKRELKLLMYHYYTYGTTLNERDLYTANIWVKCSEELKEKIMTGADDSKIWFYTPE